MIQTENLLEEGETMPLIFLDTETTGLDPQMGHEIIEIAMITRYSNGKEEVFHTKIKPQRIAAAHPKALEVNGYNEADWKGAMKMEQAIVEISKRLQYGMIVGYNPYFDWGMIKAAMKEYGIHPSWRVRCLDCMVLAYEHLRPSGLRYLSLDAVRDFLKWDKTGAHSALKDARDCQKLWDMIIEE